MRNAARRVVITGMGVVSPLGNCPQKLWEALCAGQSGIGPLEAFDPAGLPVRIAAQARDFAGKIQDFGPLEPDLKKTIRKSKKYRAHDANNAFKVGDEVRIIECAPKSKTKRWEVIAS